MSTRFSRPAYLPGQTQPYKISRSKIEFFLECARCFWLDQRLKIRRPEGAPFLLNNAVDELLKNEFDIYRSKGQQHPLQTKFNIPAKPFVHKRLDEWRDSFRGVQALHKQTNLLIFGAVDDIWVDEQARLIVVDYKATAKRKEITQLDPPGGWHDSYRRQMEIYQWLLRQNGFAVDSVGYFVYANGRLSEPEFADTLKFTTNVIPYQGDDSWIEGVIMQVKACLEGDLPQNSDSCSYCNYTAERLKLTLAAISNKG